MSWPSSTATAFSSGLIIIAIVGLWLRRSKLTGSTLIGPWWWLQIALVSLLATQLAKASGLVAASALAAVEFLAAAMTVCPIVSVLGAKRPQDKAWHFIVLCLWIILVWPTAEVFLIRSGAQLRMHAIRSGFLTLLVVLGVANYALTRYSLAACGYALGQLALLGPQITRTPSPVLGFTVGSALISLTTVWVCLDLLPRRKPVPGWNRAWLDFRDAFGAVWALRVIERINATARQLDWDVRLTWSGFREATSGENPASDAATPATLELNIERSFRMLMRRFVSTDWLPRHFV